MQVLALVGKQYKWAAAEGSRPEKQTVAAAVEDTEHTAAVVVGCDKRCTVLVVAFCFVSNRAIS